MGIFFALIFDGALAGMEQPFTFAMPAAGAIGHISNFSGNFCRIFPSDFTGILQSLYLF